MSTRHPFTPSQSRRARRPLTTAALALTALLHLAPAAAQTLELYERLKARKVLVVPGEYFFFGIEDDWPHRHECLRLNYAQPEQTMREALDIIADECARC